MHASRKHRLQLAAIVSLLLVVQTSSGQTGQAGTQAAVGPAETILESHTDTIAESAIKQRAARKIEIANKLAASAAVTPPAVPAIQVNAIPQFEGKRPPGIAAENTDQDMVLTEVLRSTVKSVAGISIFGAVRHVVAGDDLGNGWKLTEVDRFKVTLAQTSGIKKHDKSKTGSRTRVLLLGTPPRVDPKRAGMGS